MKVVCGILVVCNVALAVALVKLANDNYWLEQKYEYLWHLHQRRLTVDTE